MQPSGTGAAPINYQFCDVDAHGATIRTQVESHNPPTVVLPAGADEVSAATAALFAAYAQEYQAISVQAAAFHTQFVQALHAGDNEYSSGGAHHP